MLSVTRRIKTAYQPKTGYVPKELFNFITFEDAKTLNNIDPKLAPIQGIATDYLTRFLLTGDKESAFDISFKGAEALDYFKQTDENVNNAKRLLDGVQSLDSESIRNVCELSIYDSAYRAGIHAYKRDKSIIDLFNYNLFDNIETLVNRSLEFFKTQKPLTLSGFNFEGGYTELVSAGDGDYLTEDTLIDLKCSKSEFKREWSLQLLMYYLLGIHSNHKEFDTVTKLSIFNAVRNQSLVCNIDEISDNTKFIVSERILGYAMQYPSEDWNIDGIARYYSWREVRKDLTNYSAIIDYAVEIEQRKEAELNEIIYCR